MKVDRLLKRVLKRLYFQLWPSVEAPASKLLRSKMDDCQDCEIRAHSLFLATDATQQFRYGRITLKIKWPGSYHEA